MLEGVVADSTAKPVPDAYIINFRTQEKSISRENGVFAVNVLPNDSLAIVHVSYNRKIVRVFDLIKNPVVTLASDNINIEQVNVSPRQKSDYQRAMNNISSISDLQLYSAQKIDMAPEPTMEMMIKNNTILRSEASSLRLFRFSPSVQIRKLVDKIKKKKQ